MTTNQDELTKCQMIGRDGKWFVEHQAAKAIVDDLRRQLAEVTRDLEQEWSCGAQVLQQEREAYNEMLAKLDLVTRERDELKKERATRLCDVDRIKEWWHSNPRKNSVLAFTCGPERSIAIGMEMLADNLTQAREQLATAQAEAVAMRVEIHRIVAIMYKWHAMVTLDDYAKLFGRVFGEVVQDAHALLANTTAGRDMLDEMRRKDERIAELEREVSLQRKLKGEQIDLKHQLGLEVDSLNERIAELEKIKDDDCQLSTTELFLDGEFCNLRIASEKVRKIISGASWGRMLDVIRGHEKTIGLLGRDVKNANETWQESFDEMVSYADQLKRKCRTAKAALVKARERIAELERQVKDQEPTPEPVYWRFKERSPSQVAGFADYRCLDGECTEFCSDESLTWQKAVIRKGELDAGLHYERCNADGSPLSDYPDPAKCKSCGIAYTDHLGIQGTCKELQELRKQLPHKLSW